MSDKINKVVSEGLLNNPIKFLQKHILLVPSPAADLNCSPVRNFDFDSYMDDGGITTLNGSIDRGSLRAYYLPWSENAGYSVVCEKSEGIDLMFTAKLTGCAVGYLRASDGSGAVRVSHHNIQTSGGVADQAAMKNSLAFAQASLHPDTYRPDENSQAYFFGVKMKGGMGRSSKWRFFTQKIKMLGLGSYEIVSVSEKN